MSTRHTIHVGPTFPILLFLLFLGLKLGGVIAWSWWLVTAPLWAPVALVSVFIVVCLGIGLCVRRRV